MKLEKCAIQKSDIKLTGNSKILSPTKIDVPDSLTNEGFMSVKQICGAAMNDLVNMRVRVIKMERPFRVKSGKITQDLLVADTSGVIKMVVWGDMVGKFELEKSRSYCSGYMMVLSSCHSLKRVLVFILLRALKVLCVCMIRNAMMLTKFFEDVVVAGALIFRYKSCFKCRSKVEFISDDFVKCSKCTTVQATFSANLTPKKDEDDFECV